VASSHENSNHNRDRDNFKKMKQMKEINHYQISIPFSLFVFHAHRVAIALDVCADVLVACFFGTFCFFSLSLACRSLFFSLCELHLMRLL